MFGSLKGKPVFVVALLCAGLALAFGCGGDGDGSRCVDNDGDGYGNPASPDCSHGKLDCDDGDALVNPGATEGPLGEPTCTDGLDNDCDGAIDGDDACCDSTGMVEVPEGEFVMGSDGTDELSRVNEFPEHVVYLSAYWIDIYEVTNTEFAAFLNAYGSNTSPEGYELLDAADEDRHIFLDGDVWYAEPEYANHPVTDITWYGADTYCGYYCKRLPTEAEWEKAARGGCEVEGDPLACEDPADERTYPWGEGLDCGHANFADCVGDTTPVGSYILGTSPYGVHDMAGNVWEWAKDRYKIDYYSESPDVNPQGPESGRNRVIRGGAWGGYSLEPRCVYRYLKDPASANAGMGFRCARSLYTPADRIEFSRDSRR